MPESVKMSVKSAGAPSHGRFHAANQAHPPAALRPAHGLCPLPQANFERNSDNGAFEEQYKRLVGEISTIYEGAKEFHQHGWG
jgi:hypothetical protein